MSEIDLEPILEEFYAGVVLPEPSWDGIQFVLCVAGSVGSGKSTLLKQFADDIGLVVISSDTFRIILDKRNLRYDCLQSLIPTVVEHFLDAGYSVALDMNCGNALIQKYIPELEAAKNVRSHWISIALPAEVVEERLRKGRSAFHASFESALADYKEQSAADNPFGTIHPPFFSVTEHTTEADIATAISELKTRLLS